MNLETASENINLSVNAIKNYLKQKNFPVIGRKEILISRLIHWLNGGSANWNIREEDENNKHEIINND